MLRALLIAICLLPVLARAQNITGIVMDGDSSTPVANVTLENIYTHAALVTDSSGKFTMAAAPGQLVEFRKLGYKVARVRVPAPPMPPYYRIIMQPGAFELEEVEVRDKYRNFKKDSIRNYETFRTELIFPKLQGLDVIRSPFSALSKRNRQIWQFQHNYAYFEQEKYVDYAFNEKLIASLTGLKGDSAQAYMKEYRPTYDMLHGMKDYEFFLYIKESVAEWKRKEGQGQTGSADGH